MNPAQIAGVVFVALCIGFVGGAHEGIKHERQAQEKAIAALVDEQRAERDRMEKEHAEEIDLYIANVADLASSNFDLSSRLERMRSQASARASAKATADSGTVDGKARARCEGLLFECADLLRQGSDLLGRNAVAHDALAKSK